MAPEARCGAARISTGERPPLSQCLASLGRHLSAPGRLLGCVTPESRAVAQREFPVPRANLSVLLWSSDALAVAVAQRGFSRSNGDHLGVFVACCHTRWHGMRRANKWPADVLAVARRGVRRVNGYPTLSV